MSEPPGLPPSGGAAPGSVAPEPPRRAWWLARRVLFAGVGIVLLTGGAAYAIALNEVGKVVEALGQTKAVKVAPKVLLPTSKGAPQTLLLVGNDQRPPPKDNPDGAVLPHSNEMLLVRIDPGKPTISMLSIPRELQVTFTAPDGEVITNRINSAYTYGGIELMLKTIKNLLHISVNHVFVVTFPKFRRAVDEIGCVYMTVDRRYYHVNEPGGEQYFEINLQPGYQRLCGKEALEFVANRHEDTSLTRDARDQRFLLEVKAQYGPSLFEDREEFERVLGRAVETDLHGTDQVLDLLELLVQSAGEPVRQVPFHLTLLPTFDTATPAELEEASRSFLGGTAPIATGQINRDVATARHSAHSHSSAASGLSLTPTTGEELEQARSQAPRLPFALEYPRVRNAFAGAAPDTLRIYDIRDPQRHLHPSYVIVIDQGLLGQFYDVQGTDWTDPPLLANPSQTVHIGSRTYSLYYTGEAIRTIAWHEGGAAYWIENTLTNSVEPREMLATAEQTAPVISTGPPRATTIPTLHDINLPAPVSAADTTASSKLEAALGFLGLGLVALLAVLALARERELKPLREQVALALALEARQRPLTGGGASIPAPTPARTLHRARRGRARTFVALACVALVALAVLLAAHLILA